MDTNIIGPTIFKHNNLYSYFKQQIQYNLALNYITIFICPCYT